LHQVSQVGLAVTEMDTVTQQNAALVEQIAAAAASLRSQARDLVDTVAVLKLDTRLPLAARSALSGATSERRRMAVRSPTGAEQRGADAKPGAVNPPPVEASKMIGRASAKLAAAGAEGWEDF
jgi:hypothetical protein